MASFSGKDFVKFLPDLDQNSEDFNWIFQLGKTSSVINSICRYVDSHNVLEEDEIESYLEWEANNTYEDMGMDIHVLPNSDFVWGAEDENTLLAAEIAVSEELINCLQNRTERVKSLLEPAQEESSNSQNECESAQHQFKLAEDGCRAFSHHLLDLHSHLARDFEKWTFSLNCEAKQEAMPQFLAHCPLDDLRHKRKRCVNAITSNLERLSKELAPKQMISHTETKSLVPDSRVRFIIDGDETTFKKLLKQIDLLVGKLLHNTVNSILLNIDHESLLAAKAVLKDLLQEITSGNCAPLCGTKSDSTGAFDVICYEKIKAILHKTEKNKIVEGVMNKFSEECKSSEAKYNLKILRLKEIGDVVQEQKNLNFLMEILYQLDNATVKNAEYLSECFIEFLSDYVDQVTLMPNHSGCNFIKSEHSTSPVPIARKLPQNASISTHGVLRDLLAQANCSIASKQEEILKSIPLLLTYMLQKRQITKKLEDYVISGATKKPLVIDYKYVSSFKDHRKQHDNNLEECGQAQRAVEQMELDWKQNPGLWGMRLIWVLFMNGNVERLEAIASGDFSAFTIKQKKIGSHRKRGVTFESKEN